MLDWQEAVTKQRGASSQLFARMKTSEMQRECADVAAYLNQDGAITDPPIQYGPGINLARVLYLPGPKPHIVNLSRYVRPSPSSSFVSCGNA